MTDYLEVTELAGEPVSAEQIQRLERRYFWARHYCAGVDVHELACGTGQSVALLAQVAKSFAASDGSQPMLEIAKKYYGQRIAFGKLDAQSVPLADASVDVLILFEALYYLPNADAFFRQAYRVLRSGGVLLIATANKDLYDFNPSPHSHEYLGVAELSRRLGSTGFSVEMFGDTPLAEVSTLQKMLRPVKNMASKLGLIPKSMAAKKLLKRLVFGKLISMPAEIFYDESRYIAPVPLALGVPDQKYKVILCAAHKAV